MPTENDAGTQTAVIDTEHTLKSLSADGTYSLYVDLTNMAAGDRTVIRTKVKVKAAGSEITSIEDVIYGEDVVNQSQTPLYQSIPTMMTETMSYTLEQTDGTGRDYDWQVLEV